MEKKYISAAVLGAVLAVNAQAYEITESQKNVEIGLEYGNYDQEYSIDGLDGELTGDDTGYRIFATFYQTSNIGIRVGYTDFGSAVIFDEYQSNGIDFIEASLESSVSALTIGAVMSSAITNGPIEFNAELGLAKWNVDLAYQENSSMFGSYSDKDSDDGVSIYGGFGARLQATKSFGIGLNILWYVFEADLAGDTYDIQVDAITLNSVYRF